MKSHEIHLIARPKGMPAPGIFARKEVDLPAPGPGQVLVKNSLMSVDPYMRGRMEDRPSYVPPFALGEVMQGGAAGYVIASNEPDLPVGTAVISMFGWREAFIADAKQVQKVDTALAPLGAYLGVLGMPGLTAYVGLHDIAALKDGETVFVSGAAGAVGSLVCQLAKLRGCRVIASAGSGAKLHYLSHDLKVDHAFSYRGADLRAELRKGAPDGIDVYFDNVGGDHLEAAIQAARPFARFAMCGAISQYNVGEPKGPSNMMMIVGKRLTLKGFIVTDHAKKRGEFLAAVGPKVKSGEIVNREHIVEGLDAAPGALIDLLSSGEKIGKSLVKLA